MRTRGAPGGGRAGVAIGRRRLFARATAPPPPGSWVHVSRPAMACRFELTVPAEDAGGIAACTGALDEVGAVEAQLSVFRGQSEVSRLNRTAHAAPVAASADLYRLLDLCHRLHRDTEGAFDPTSGPLTRCWGFFNRAGALPAADRLAAARAVVGLAHVEQDPHARSVSFACAGVELNFGSIGKGYALDRAAGVLRRAGVATALLSAGSSSISALGPAGWAGGWRVGLRHPRDHASRWAVLHLRNCALATSGAGEQFFEHAGRRYGHILDPRTGWPVEGRLAVTVVASRAAEADALATAFFVGGAPLAESYCARHPGVLALIHDDSASAPAIIGSHRGCHVQICRG